MKIDQICIRNFRRLQDVKIDVEERETVFVGPNNSGKTSASAALRSFLDGRTFRIHDISVARISDIDSYGTDQEGKELPAIELDVWFSVDPDTIEFGRAFSLLPRLSEEFKRLGVRLKYGVADPDKLISDYRKAYPIDIPDEKRKSLSQFLAIDQNFRSAFEISYFSLEQADDAVSESALDQKEGRALVKSLLRVDFVDAQRNINDEESNRSNRLSSAFAAFYRNNLEQAEAAAAAHEVIDQNNKSLTSHYEAQFSDIMTVIKGLGVPSINDRTLRIVSSLSPESALQGNTDLLYIDLVRKHELPELYNGLGFKNLIYMAIQVRHFHLQWLKTAESRPLCQLIFIEEPEVHLHAQVQQTFIANIWKVIADSALAAEEPMAVPQIAVTTHSSHILDAVDFAKVRYFRRCPLAGEEDGPPGILNATAVHSLRSFKPEPFEENGKAVSEQEALTFLKRYLRLTHCDLFFSDAAILVEGAVEKLLLPAMIEKAAKGLSSAYLSVLEIGGAFAHRFEGLLSFLHIPYLVVTDLDSVALEGRHPACRGDAPGALTSNASLKRYFGVTTVEELLALTDAQKVDDVKDRCVTFQTDVAVTEGGTTLSMRPRTLEEAFAYQNFALVRSDSLGFDTDIPAALPDAYQRIYERIGESDFKKTDFAMGVLALPEDSWVVPIYITDGLAWLEYRLRPPDQPNDAPAANPAPAPAS